MNERLENDEKEGGKQSSEEEARHLEFSPIWA